MPFDLTAAGAGTASESAATMVQIPSKPRRIHETFTTAVANYWLAARFPGESTNWQVSGFWCQLSRFESWLPNSRFRLYASPVSDSLTVLVMAAGEGTRMRSSIPKVLHPVCGRPLVAWPVLAAREAGADRVAVIVSPDRDISSALPEGTETVVQPEADGTGGALRAAADLIRDAGTVLVLSGDHPLISAEAIGELLATHRDAGAAATITTVELDDPGAYGRVVRDRKGRVKKIVEAKEPGDATEEELAITEVNAGTYAFEAAPSPKPSRRSPTTTPRASTTSATCCRCSARSPPTAPPTRG